MTGRNDPCPCGSGKKYKHCCWRKEQAAQAQNITGNDVTAQNDVTTEDAAPSPEPDPLMERINAFWEDFMDAPYEEKWALATEMLAEEPELCDAQMVFEIGNGLFDQAVTRGDINRFKELLEQIQAAAPEAYESELRYILEWRIQIALMEGDEAGVERYFYRFSPLAGDELDVYYRVVSQLAYHGKLDVLYHGMRQARPYVAEGEDLVAWAYEEFIDRLAALEIRYLLEQNPNLKEDDPTLQAHFAEYELTIDPEGMATTLDYRTGRKTPAWSIADFEAAAKKEEEQVQENLRHLLAAFSYYAHDEEGFARTKIKMACDELAKYLGQRREGELDKSEADHGRRFRRKRKQKQQQRPPLRPDAKTLNVYLDRLLGFMAFRYYEACALFELIPIWLRFLTKYDLLEEETRRETLQELSGIKGHLTQIVGKQISDPLPQENLADWPYEPKAG